MDPMTRNALISQTIQTERNFEIRDKLRELLVERQVPFFSSTDDMQQLKSVGVGAFGLVDLVRYQRKLYAFKKPRYNTPKQRASILEEALKLTEINEYHPNIQRLHFINLSTFGILMDYCNCGSLDRVVTDTTFKYTLKDALLWGYQLADALSFLHSKNIMHRDVKVQNILLKDNCQTLVLTDYGTATNLGRTSLTNGAGTQVTMAPEVHKGTTYNEQCDVYSWAIVMWQLLSKDLSPYGKHNISFIVKVVTENLRPSKFSHCPQIFIALLYRTWHSNPSERPTLSFIKQVLRVILNVLPSTKQEYSEEVINDTRTRWINDSTSARKALLNAPRPTSEHSNNIYQDLLRKMKNVLEIKQDISELEEQISTLSKENESKHDHYDQLLNENEILQEKINALRLSHHR